MVPPYFTACSHRQPPGVRRISPGYSGAVTRAPRLSLLVFRSVSGSRMYSQKWLPAPLTTRPLSVGPVFATSSYHCRSLCRYEAIIAGSENLSRDFSQFLSKHPAAQAIRPVGLVLLPEEQGAGRAGLDTDRLQSLLDPHQTAIAFDHPVLFCKFGSPKRTSHKTTPATYT